MLDDPSHVVRSLLAFGICKICAVYWEYIPAEVLKTFLTSVIQKHAWDSSNTEVRLSVIKVLSLLISALIVSFSVALLICRIQDLQNVSYYIRSVFGSLEK